MKNSVYTLFPLYYYHTSLSPEEVDLVRECIDFNAKTYETKGEGWIFSVNASFPPFLEAHGDECLNHTGNTLIDVDRFSTLLSYHMRSFINEVYSGEDCHRFFDNVKNAADIEGWGFEVELMIKDCWLNIYNKGQAQEVHSHEAGRANFSGCIFSKYDHNKDARLAFSNTEKSFTSSGYFPIFAPTDSFYPEVKENDLIIFPSLSPHFVEEQKYDTNRTTIAFNFDVRPDIMSNGTRSGDAMKTGEHFVGGNKRQELNNFKCARNRIF